MRFRLATGPQGSRQIAETFGHGMDTLFQAPLMQLQGAEEAQNAQMKRDLMGAQLDSERAHAALFGQQADAERQKVDARTPTQLITTAAMVNKLGPDQIPELQQYIQSGGHLAGKYELPSDQQGPVLPKPAYADPNGVGGDIMRTLGLLQGGMAVGGNIENVTKAGGDLQKQDAVRTVMTDPTKAPNVGQAYAAVEGKPLVSAVGTSGRNMNVFTGNGGTIDPGMAVLFDNNERALTGARNASANASNASAGASRALEDQRRAVTAAGPGGAGGAGGKAPSGYRYAMGQDGEVRLEPIPGGPKDPSNKPGIPLPSSAAKGYLDNIQNLRRAERAFALATGQTVNGIKGDPEATGWKGIVPGAILNRFDQEGVNTRAAIADLGSLVIHDRSGAAVTAAEMPRLAPFIPNPTDDAVTVKKKLAQFVANYRSVIDDATNFYRASGYAVPNVDGTGVQPAAGGSAPDPLGLRR